MDNHGISQFPVYIDLYSCFQFCRWPHRCKDPCQSKSDGPSHHQNSGDWMIFHPPWWGYNGDIMEIYLWYIYDIFMIYLWYIYDIFMIYLWYIYDIFMIYLWYIYDIFMIYLWYIYDIFMIYLWYIAESWFMWTIPTLRSLRCACAMPSHSASSSMLAHLSRFPSCPFFIWQADAVGPAPCYYWWPT